MRAGIRQNEPALWEIVQVCGPGKSNIEHVHVHVHVYESHKSRCECVHIRTLKTKTCKHLCRQVFFYQQFHDNEMVFFCRYSSAMRFHHQKGFPHCRFIA